MLTRLSLRAQGALLASELDKLVIAINTDRGVVVEQFVFDMPVSAQVPGCILLAFMALEHICLQMMLTSMSPVDISELEPLFRSALLKLQNCAALLEPIPSGGSIQLNLPVGILTFLLSDQNLPYDGPAGCILFWPACVCHAAARSPKPYPAFLTCPYLLSGAALSVRAQHIQYAGQCILILQM